MEEIVKDYIVKLLELQETKLKCINLGYSPDKVIKAELSLIKLALKEIERRWK